VPPREGVRCPCRAECRERKWWCRCGTARRSARAAGAARGAVERHRGGALSGLIPRAVTSGGSTSSSHAGEATTRLRLLFPHASGSSRVLR
jgi:hypothetical protein